MAFKEKRGKEWRNGGARKVLCSCKSTTAPIVPLFGKLVVAGPTLFPSEHLVIRTIEHPKRKPKTRSKMVKDTRSSRWETWPGDLFAIRSCFRSIRFRVVVLSGSFMLCYT
jgi:hypothetical protein